MKNIKYILLLLCLPAMVLSSCKKEPDPIYGVVEQTIGNGEKKNLKSDQQYVAVLHANLFQEAVSASAMVEIGRVIQSIGDKGLAYELIVSSFMNDGDVVLPTNDYMRNNIDKFITETFERFYVRPPSEAEKEWLKGYIETNPSVTVELVYFAFAISDEYYFY